MDHLSFCGWSYLLTVSNSSLLLHHVAVSGFPIFTFPLSAEKGTFPSRDREFWPMTLSFGFDHIWVKLT